MSLIGDEESAPVKFTFDPPTRPTPTRLKLRNTEESVPIPARELGPIGVQEVPRGASHAAWSSEQPQAMFATILLILKTPSKSKQRQQHKDLGLNDVRNERVHLFERLIHIKTTGECNRKDKK